MVILASETWFGLDGVVPRISHLLREHGSPRSVYDGVLNGFDVEPARLEGDLLTLAAQLADVGLGTPDAEHAPTT